VNLTVGETYFLVPTTYQQEVIGAFNLTITGVAQVNLTKQNCEFYSPKRSISLPSFE
jgi:hypothetical protein